MKPEYSIEEVVQATGGQLSLKSTALAVISELLIDSRKLIHPAQTLFFALGGQKLDGHNYIEELYRKGVRNFIVTKEQQAETFPEANFVLVKDSLEALQKLAGFHRSKFDLPVISITGSNGKTIVKEWLYQLLHEDYHVVRNPKSYNSQVGVPLSLWLIRPENTLGIFEAGISEPDEMQKLEKMIRPNIGVFTNVGEAHSAGFLSSRHKTKEKLKLFVNAGILIYCKDYPDINQSIAEINTLSKGGEEREDKIKTFTWSRSSGADMQVNMVAQKDNHSFMNCVYQNQELDIEIPFSDQASVENALHCVCVLLYLKMDPTVIRERMRHLTGIKMRLEMKDAINDCTLINDTYNSDIGSLKIAIDFLKQQNQHPKKTIILSDILQSGRGEIDLYSEVSSLLEENKVNQLIGIGPALSRQQNLFAKNNLLHFESYENTDDFLKHLDTSRFRNEVILLKGARKFRFEVIGKFLEKKAHETVLEINLNALTHNLKVYQSLLRPETKIMAMVKAFSYGSGSFEIANVLQFNHVDYLAVAYSDEGVELRKNGITLPIMVMNPEQRSFESMIQYHLEPEIYTLSLLDKFSEVLAVLRHGDDSKYKIHLELETGMNRLGFNREEIPALIERIKLNHHLQVASVFSHLAASESKLHDDFTQEQIRNFDAMSSDICSHFDYKILRHILNSTGITRHTSSQFDMVRLGIGLYGIDSSEKVHGQLMTVSTLKTTISQIRKVKSGDTVGYGRVGQISDELPAGQTGLPTDRLSDAAGHAGTGRTIATIAIGYADGLSRRLSNKVGRMWVNGKLAPIIGNVCMDMTMLDITGIAANEGDEVIVFGKNPTVEEIAEAAETIPYEIMTGISARVKRVYFQE